MSKTLLAALSTVCVLPSNVACTCWVEPPSSRAVLSMTLKVCRFRAGARLSADGAGAVRAPAKMTLPRSRQAASTVGFREIETTVFDPASVFLSTHR
jgi:hypothetical protein